jgi:hypothetical protein
MVEAVHSMRQALRGLTPLNPPPPIPPQKVMAFNPTLKAQDQHRPR